MKSTRPIGDLLRISEAFAASLSNLFAFVKSGHPACPFITHKQLALYANPRFWQYGLPAFIARCCSFDNQNRHQGPGTAQAEEGKSQTTKEKAVDALTFMRTVIMAFVRGMEHGEQTLPTNDLFVYLPVQILPDLVVAMERQGFTPAEGKGGYGYRPKEEDAEDNPLLVVGVHTKDIVYDRYPRMPDTSWAERAYFSGALDPSLGQAFSFFPRVNSSGPGQRCSVGSSLRYQRTPSTREQRSAQDYTFEALHWVYFYDAWRVQPVLGAPESDLVLPPKQGLLEHGCYWPRPNLTPEVLSISDRDPEKEEQEVQEEQSPTSLAVTDAAMAEEDANEAVSIYSSSSESPTIPSTEQSEVLPPQDVDPATSSPTSQSSESPIKRRQGSKASAGRAQSKKLRKSLAPPSRQPLGSIPEHEQPQATLADLASQNAQNLVAPACRNPTTPPDRPAWAQERPHAMTEIDIASDQENAERGGTADTDLQLESEQRAMQALYDYQNAARTARETARQRAPLPASQIYCDLPREWPMARLAISSKQINRLVRTFLWRRVTEQALRGSSLLTFRMKSTRPI